MSIEWLGTYACHNPRVVGGKAASLSRLSHDYPVPPGFCLSAGASTGKILEGQLLDDLVQAYHELGDRCADPRIAVAVRSSAVDEDGQSASFAGQFETYLNISGPEAVVEAVRCCLESARSDRVLSYRRSLGLLEEAPLAVLVQQFIHADISAVVFSADPCSGDTERVLINAVWGLGESLVGGTVTPDLFSIDKTSLKLLQCQISDKACMTVACSGGTQEVAVPRALRQEACMDLRSLQDLARLAVALEINQGWPVDLECVLHNEHNYLLQCRPITTIHTMLPRMVSLAVK
jgi:pyruvate,water dikinase